MFAQTVARLAAVSKESGGAGRPRRRLSTASAAGLLCYLAIASCLPHLAICSEQREQAVEKTPPAGLPDAGLSHSAESSDQRERSIELTLVAGAPLAGSCSAPGVGWCIARRIAGNVPGGELGFRFGEPLDVDGDGHADIAAGARFKPQHGTLQNGSAAVWSGASGALIRSWDGDLPDGLFGHWVLPVPDLGHDGLADLIISAPNARVGGLVRGVLVARSPKTGEELWKHAGSRSENFGWDLDLAGDYDGDGRSDLFVGAPSTDAGRVYLLSGKDGTLLRTYAPDTDVPTFGWYVARLDDLDGDGHADLAVGACLERVSADSFAGGAYVFSSASGKELYHWKGTGAGDGFGEIVAAIGDLDGDGHGEVVVSSPRTFDQTHTRPGEVRIYSGTTGKELRHWSGTQPGEIYGRMVIAAGDVDGDGVEDLAIGAPWHRGAAGDRAGRVELRSGKSGKVLGELFGDAADGWFGWHIRRAPDPDGLGRPTLLIGSLRHPVEGQAAVGVLDLYVLRRESKVHAHGTMTRGARRKDIK